MNDIIKGILIAVGSGILLAIIFWIVKVMKNKGEKRKKEDSFKSGFVRSPDWK